MLKRVVFRPFSPLFHLKMNDLKEFWLFLALLVGLSCFFGWMLTIILYNHF